MPFAPSPGRSWGALALLLLAVAMGACGQQSSVKDISGPPDLLKGAKPDPRWRAYRLRAYQLHHIWAGIGHAGPDGADYRVKVSVWDHALEKSLDPIAELYFHDPDRYEPAGRHRNPDPNQAKMPYQLHFPAATAGPILAAMRSANDAVCLYYYDNEWSVGVVGPEAVGVE